MSVFYHGGPLLQHVQIETVFYGRDWYYNSTLYQSTAYLDGYFNDVTQSSYMDLLNEYGVGRGSFRDGVIRLADPPRGSVVDDSEIQSMLDGGIRQGYFDAPSPNQLYFVFTTPNVLVTALGGDSQHLFLGYHSAFYDPALGPVYYAVIPHPIGNATIGGMNSFDQQTAVASHELAEAATDPDVQSGWYDNNGQEIGDLAVNYFGSLHGYVVQAEYSNYYNDAVIPYDATWYYPGGYAAPPEAGHRQLLTEGILPLSQSSPLQASGPAHFESVADLARALAAQVLSHRTGQEARRDDVFAAFGDPLSPNGHQNKRAAEGTGSLASEVASSLASSVN
jgi:hypothetical protein